MRNIFNGRLLWLALLIATAMTMGACSTTGTGRTTDTVTRSAVTDQAAPGRAQTLPGDGPSYPLARSTDPLGRPTGMRAVHPLAKSDSPLVKAEALPFKGRLVTLSFDLPPRWGFSLKTIRKFNTRLYLLYHPQGGVIVLSAYATTEGRPDETVAYLAKTDWRQSFKQQIMTASGDRLKARWTWHDRLDQRSGITEAHVLADDPRVTVLLIGSWPAKYGLPRSADFDLIAKSVSFK